MCSSVYHADETQKNKNINDFLLKCLDRGERDISIKFAWLFTKNVHTESKMRQTIFY